MTKLKKKSFNLLSRFKTVGRVSRRIVFGWENEIVIENFFSDFQTLCVCDDVMNDDKGHLSMVTFLLIADTSIQCPRNSRSASSIASQFKTLAKCANSFGYLPHSLFY